MSKSYAKCEDSVRMAIEMQTCYYTRLGYKVVLVLSLANNSSIRAFIMALHYNYNDIGHEWSLLMDIMDSKSDALMAFNSRP